MLQRSGWGVNDGAWLLWFNSPYDPGNNGNAYNVMHCRGPAGPCGAESKPRLTFCDFHAGDFGIVPDGTQGPWIICSTSGAKVASLAEEQLSPYGVNGTGRGRNNAVMIPVRQPRKGSQPAGLAGLTSAEGVGAFRLPSGPDPWVMTYSDPVCGYCGGTGTGYATSPFIGGPWTARGFASPPNSCGGQPRTVSLISGQPYEGIDLWQNGNPNETAAGLLFQPLLWTTSGLAPWTCPSQAGG
jgi:hypothetical protein